MRMNSSFHQVFIKDALHVVVFFACEKEVHTTVVSAKSISMYKKLLLTVSKISLKYVLGT